MGFYGGCQNDGPFFGSSFSYGPEYLGYPTRDHNFASLPYGPHVEGRGSLCRAFFWPSMFVWGSGTFPNHTSHHTV